MTAYYNEIDPYAAEWLRNLIREGLIAPGDVDERSIVEVHPDDLRGYTQCHFFAGIGGWSLALRMAGWSDDRPVWTGSCPCQPFSSAGRGGGEGDERHLWPEMRRLVSECRPPVVFGEQVASALGRGWLAGVRADLEELGYAVGAADLCAAGVGAPHIRQRLWWVADAKCDPGGTRRAADEPGRGAEAATAGAPVEPGRRGGAGGMADHGRDGWERRAETEGPDAHVAGERDQGAGKPEPHRAPCDRLGRSSGEGLAQRGSDGRIQREALGPLAREAALGAGDASGLPHPARGREGAEEQRGQLRGSERVGASPWRGVWLPCADGKARRIEPGLESLAYGVSGRVGRLRAYGNAIVPHVAETFIRAYLESA